MAAQLKTQKNDASVATFLASIRDPAQRADAATLAKLFQRATGQKPKMWGSSIVGYGEYTYRYATGREGQWMLTGFSPRAKNLTLYVMAGFDAFGPLLKKLGPASTAKSCLYLPGLAGVDLKVLEALVKKGAAATRAMEQAMLKQSAAAKKKKKR